MNDLISRKTLLKDVKCMIMCDVKTRDRAIELIENQPTAYDVDKVVSELENEIKRLKTLKNNCIALCDHEVIGIENKTYDYAIKIVRNGGNDE